MDQLSERDTCQEHLLILKSITYCVVSRSPFTWILHVYTCTCVKCFIWEGNYCGVQQHASPDVQDLLLWFLRLLTFNIVSLYVQCTCSTITIFVGGREGEVRGISPFKRKKLLFYNDCCLQVSLASPHLPTMEQLAPSITYWHPPFSPTSHLHKLSKELRECVKVALTSRMMSHTTQGASVRSVSVGTMSNVPRSAISPLMNPTYCLISTPTKVSDITIWPVHKIHNKIKLTQ